ncbi:MAG: YbfB/YjiJ family MFS transporter [Acidimicrobiales bacterium]
MATVREQSNERGSGLGIALGLALGPAISLGFARFAYALLLPAMRADLGWSFSVAGAMNTANALGYLAGALLAVPMARRVGSRWAFLAALGVTALALLASAVSGNLLILMTLRLVAGAGGAVSFVIGGGLAAQAGHRNGLGRAALLLGVYFAGAGAGIVVSGLAVPLLLAHTGIGVGWRQGWLLLGGMAIVALVGSVPATLKAQEPPPPKSPKDRWPARSMSVLLVAYLLFGAGYISYMTFIVAFLKGEGASAGEVSVFWVVLGAAAMAATFAWAPVLGRLRGGRGPAAVLAVVGTGALLPVLSASAWAVFASAVLFGGSFLTVVTAVTAVARVSLHPRHWTPAIATLTVAFALGQCAGPILAGVLSDGPSGVRAGLVLSVGILAAGMLTALAQPRRDTSAHALAAGNGP